MILSNSSLLSINISSPPKTIYFFTQRVPYYLLVFILRIQAHNHTLSGPDLPYHFVGSPLILQVLSHRWSIYFYFADASARTSSDTPQRVLIFFFYTNQRKAVKIILE